MESYSDLGLEFPIRGQEEKDGSALLPSFLSFHSFLKNVEFIFENELGVSRLNILCYAIIFAWKASTSTRSRVRADSLQASMMTHVPKVVL